MVATKNAATKISSVIFHLFFFSSRRRHTRFDCDWSSDVCSSDLASDWIERSPVWISAGSPGARWITVKETNVMPSKSGRARRSRRSAYPSMARYCIQIGRASCRERGEISGGAVSLKKKKREEREE